MKQFTLVCCVVMMLSGCGDESASVSPDPEPLAAELAVAVVSPPGDATALAPLSQIPTTLEAVVFDVHDGKRGTSLKGPVPLTVTASQVGFEVWVRDLPPGEIWLEVNQIGTIMQNRSETHRIILSSAARRLSVTAGSGQVVVLKQQDFVATGFDYDNDGITNLDEVEVGTNPLLGDSDADRIPDGIDKYPLNRSLH